MLEQLKSLDRKMQDLEEATSVVNYSPQKPQSPISRMNANDRSTKSDADKSGRSDDQCCHDKWQMGAFDTAIVAYCSILAVPESRRESSSSSASSSSHSPQTVSLGSDSPNSFSDGADDDQGTETDLILSCDDAASDEYWNHVQELPAEDTHTAAAVAAAASAASESLHAAAGIDDSAAADACWLPAPCRPDWSELFRTAYPYEAPASPAPDCADVTASAASGPGPSPAAAADASDEELIALLAGCAGSTPPAAPAAAPRPARFAAAPHAVAPWAWGGPGLFSGL